MVWQSALDGRTLRFHLAGINNQNFLMQDEETGSWWQQITGIAIAGPLTGQRLTRVFHDELTFATWTAEQPAGRVLRPASDSAWVTFSDDWEAETARMPVNVRARLDSTLPPRAVVLGVTVEGRAKAYPLERLSRQNPIMDRLGGAGIMLVLGEDGRSVRGFRTELDGEINEFFLKPGASPLRLVDAATGSAWDFRGVAVDGARTGQRLTPLVVQTDYWFNWQTYHPKSQLYQLGR